MYGIVHQPEGILVIGRMNEPVLHRAVELGPNLVSRLEAVTLTEN